MGEVCRLVALTRVASILQYNEQQLEVELIFVDFSLLRMIFLECSFPQWLRRFLRDDELFELLNCCYMLDGTDTGG